MFEHDTQRQSFIESFTLHTTTFNSYILSQPYTWMYTQTIAQSLYIMIVIVISKRYKLCNSMQVKLISWYFEPLHTLNRKLHEANAILQNIKTMVKCY